MGNIIRRLDIIGMPVIDINKGEKIGEIGDIIFENRSGILKGLVAILNHWIKKQVIIMHEHISTIGEYSIVMHGYNDVLYKTYGLSLGKNLIGVKLIREDGYEIGKVSDIFIDKEKWTISGYEFSRGIIDDFVYGRGFIPYPIPYGLDNNALVVTNIQYEDIKLCNDKGIKNIFFNRIK